MISTFLANLSSPPLLFFFLGALAVAVRSDLEIPNQIAKFLSLYLLFAIGFKGGVALAEAVVKIIDEKDSNFHYLYDDKLPLWEKVEAVAQSIYHATEVEADKKVRDKFRDIQEAGYGHLPVCMAKTQYSFSSDPSLLGAPKHFSLHVRDVKLSAGAEFVVVYCGDIMTLPGLPKVPSAEKIDVDAHGRISGLF